MVACCWLVKKRKNATQPKEQKQNVLSFHYPFICSEQSSTSKTITVPSTVFRNKVFYPYDGTSLRN
jgi:hypothetical protein